MAVWRLAAASVAVLLTTTVRSGTTCSRVATRFCLITVTAATVSVPPTMASVVPITLGAVHATAAYGSLVFSTPVAEQPWTEPKVLSEILPP